MLTTENSIEGAIPQEVMRAAHHAAKRIRWKKSKPPGLVPSQTKLAALEAVARTAVPALGDRIFNVAASGQFVTLD
jgi:hypothetical protein